MVPTDDELKAQVARLSKELDDRTAQHARIEPYYENETDSLAIPPLVSQARLTKLYRYLIPAAEAPWGSLVVDSKLDRLEVSGIRDDDDDAAGLAWDIWQECYMDSESKLAHSAALLDGRCCATVWPDEDGEPDIALDDITQMVVEFEPGSRHRRRAALRRWQDGDSVYVTLYRADGLWKFQSPRYGTSGPIGDWEPRKILGEEWPLVNPLGVVPVVEIPVNRRLKPGCFPHARGEFAHCTGLIDRINLLTFLGLLVAFWIGFPVRGVTGEKIRREKIVDDNGDPIFDSETGKAKTRAIAPIDMQPDSFAQFENPDARIFEFKPADRKNLSVFAELDQLANITKTARHYFPLEQGMSNLSAEAIVASEGGMLAAVTGHKSTLGEAWEEVLRIACRIKNVTLTRRAEMDWKKHESRSLAEQADAFSKFTSGTAPLPWMAAAELALNVTATQIDQWQSEAATNPLVQMVAAATQPQNGNAPTPVPTPAGG